MTTSPESPEIRIAFDQAGSGEPALLMLPGWCADRTLYRDLLPLTSRHRTSVTLDWRGHGDSKCADTDFGSADLADDALAVIEALELHRFVPVAAGHAGWIAIELQRRLGVDRVPGIVSLSWMVLGPPPPFLPAMAGLQDPDQWKGVRDSLAAMWTAGVDSPAVQQYVDAMTAYDFDMWSRAGREIAADFATHSSPVEALSALGAPTLHLYAQPRDDCFLAAQREFSEQHPWLRVQRMRGQSHFPALEEPVNTAVAIETFVSAMDR